MSGTVPRLSSYFRLGRTLKWTLGVLELDWCTFRTCLPMLQVSVQRHLPGLSNFIATVQVLVSWLMCSHVGSRELLLFSFRSCCIAVAVSIAVLWLCCAQFTGKHALSTTSLLNSSASLGADMLAWKRLARQRGWSPLVQSGLKEPRSIHKEIPLFFQLSLHSHVCKLVQAI